MTSRASVYAQLCDPYSSRVFLRPLDVFWFNDALTVDWRQSSCLRVEITSTNVFEAGLCRKLRASEAGRDESWHPVTPLQQQNEQLWLSNSD